MSREDTPEEVAQPDEARTEKPPSGMSFARFDIATTLHYPPDASTPLSFCLDSGSSISLIGRACFEKYFQDSTIRLAPILIPVAGVAGVTRTTEYINIEVRLKSEKGKFIRIGGEFHIVPSLSCSILLANDILHTYQGILDIGAEKATFANTHVIPISVFKKASALPNMPPFPVKKVARNPPRRRKVAVYAAGSTVIEAGQGINISVKHRPLPAGKSYLFMPYPIEDMATGRLASGSKAILSDDPEAVPFANFGESAIRIHPKRQLGCLEELKDSHLGAQVIRDTLMTRVFIGETDLGDNQPFVIAKDKDEDFDVVLADISEH
ncbi:hypothetical protein EPUS_09242 [Endocarpon pusillum Z07020]|uniref:Peptidase A2 domain-containing protein n=1 Tax=Endocarpon pusillum (strain Z07020 / HMAS-L-300199) TaxID=1263415 RepID=U1GCA7_ENDPU|nr:uncharacterized protein EPUS_09242 [Endocarpon pusillum Z07020]ERF69336.1 hypothetical protein EPUS_09242 [Endocarpon pusillum Z07020]